MRDPKVSVQVLTYRPFYIFREVTRPGEYPYSTGMSVLNARWLAAAIPIAPTRTTSSCGATTRITARPASATSWPATSVRVPEHFCRRAASSGPDGHIPSGTASAMTGAMTPSASRRDASRLIISVSSGLRAARWRKSVRWRPSSTQ